jgi:hypothetical protein
VGKSCRMYAREAKCFQNSVPGTLTGTDHFPDLDVNGRIILKWTRRKFMCGRRESCEYCDEFSGSVRTERFADCMSDC